MGYQLFKGCTLRAQDEGIQVASMAVLGALDVDVVGDTGGCCGYPLRYIDPEGSVLQAARYLAQAEGAGHDLLVMCGSCFTSFKRARSLLHLDLGLRSRVNGVLQHEGLVYRGEARIVHLLSLYRHAIGLDAIREKVVTPLTGVRAGVQYGCHMRRLSYMPGVMGEGVPSFFDLLIEAIGMESVAYDGKFNCCGAPLNGIDTPLAMRMAREKLESIARLGGRYIVTGCPHCYRQFSSANDGESLLPEPMAYSQLLGLALGLSPEHLGMGGDLVLP